MSASTVAAPAPSQPVEPLLHAGWLVLVLGVAAALGRGRALGPLPLVGGVLGYGTLVALSPRLRRSRPSLGAGRASPAVVGLALVTSVGSIGALVLWRRSAAPELSDLRALVPNVSLTGLIGLGIAFAFLNAAAEEIVFRGVWLPALESELGPALGLVLDSVAFGAVHVQSGFPRGLSGFGLVTLYGLALGGLRRLSGGMLAPWLVHVVADATIYILVVRSTF